MNAIPDTMPTWATLLLFVLAALTQFYPKIKSTIEKWMTGKQAMEAKKLDANLSDIDKLKQRIGTLEKENKELMEAKLTLSTAMVFMIDEYAKANPENKTVIEKLRHLIRSSPLDASV